MYTHINDLAFSLFWLAVYATEVMFLTYYLSSHSIIVIGAQLIQVQSLICREKKQKNENTKPLIQNLSPFMIMNMFRSAQTKNICGQITAKRCIVRGVASDTNKNMKVSKKFSLSYRSMSLKAYPMPETAKQFCDESRCYNP